MLLVSWRSAWNGVCMLPEAKGNLLIVDDDPNILSALSRFLGRVGFKVTAVETAEEGLDVLAGEVIDVALVDFILPGMSGMEFLTRARSMRVDTEIIIMTGLPTVQRAVEAVRAGAYDFLEKPLPDPEKVEILIERAVAHSRLHRDYEKLQRQVDGTLQLGLFIGKSPVMQALFAEIVNFAWSNASVLVLGETGTGKELVAEAIYRHSPRSNKPFHALACPTLHDHLFESELFGHVKGAFTGADRDKRGLVEALDGGTLFLDEIGDISLGNQARLLRFLSTGQFSRLGEETRTRHADVRIIAATNADLEKAVAEGRFRQDLYQRLKVLTIEVPPLRDRLEDVPHLAYFFLRRLAEKEGATVRRISAEAMEVLARYPWSEGNVRQLENVIWLAVTRARNQDEITLDHLPQDLKAFQEETPRPVPSSYPYVEEMTRKTYKRAKKLAEHHFARYYFGQLLERHGGVINQAARAAGMDPPNFRKKLKEIDLDPALYRR